MNIPRSYSIAFYVAAAAIALGFVTSIPVVTSLGVVGLVGAAATLLAQRVADRAKSRPANESSGISARDGALEIPGGLETWVRGVSHYQDALNKIGEGPVQLAFVAEPGNKFDDRAVKVCAILGSRQIHVGYLRAGTDSTIAIHDLAIHLEKSGRFITGPGEVELGEVGLAVRVQAPDYRRVREILMEIEQSARTTRGPFRSISSSAPQHHLPSDFFRDMDLKNQQEFAGNLDQFQTEIGNHVVWYLLNPISDDEVGVHISFPGEFPGPQIGRVAKRHLTYALAYTHNGPVCGRGYLRVGFNGNVSPTLGDPDWK